MTLQVDRARCIGAGSCVLARPDLFDQDEDGVVVVLAPPGATEVDGSADEVAESCPSGALSKMEAS
ncbi:ferredoxin [Pseudonocardia xishanensis]|uniref:Ferredoxin n=1 Tax=Pseudonocardia xishanensis TaxID=630995 RepID=A0ABP8RTP3_9PSEU